jgi:hypothetical protein
MIVCKVPQSKEPTFKEMCDEFERQMDEAIETRENLPIIQGEFTEEVVTAMLERYKNEGGYKIVRGGQSRSGWHFEITNL